MADDADKAQEAMERAEAHREARAYREPILFLMCRECGDILEPHRMEFGTCIECQRALERQADLYTRRGWPA